MIDSKISLSKLLELIFSSLGKTPSSGRMFHYKINLLVKMGIKNRLQCIIKTDFFIKSMIHSPSVYSLTLILD